MVVTAFKKTIPPLLTLATVFTPLQVHSQNPSSELVINEILAVNDSAYSFENRGIVTFPDVIELYNSSDDSISLQGFFLSDDPTNPQKWVLPRQFVPPRSFAVVRATGGGESEPFGPLETNFRLSNQGESLLLSAPDGTLIQRVDFPQQFSNVSWGRRSDGSFSFFRPASIGAANDEAQAFDLIIPRPSTDQESGFYENSLTVTLTSEPASQIRFTTDGSQPTASSPLYTSALTFTETTVLKSVSVQGNAVSDVASRTFIIGENPHELPVIILTADELRYDRSVNATYGSYFLDGRVRFDFVETDGSLPISQYAEFQSSGLSSRLIPPFNGKIYARNRLGPSRLGHRFFPEKEEDSFERILLRNTSQDFSMARMRDAVISRIISEGDVVESPHEGYRPAVVYLNGEYVGHMNIREDDDQAFVDQYYEFDSEVNGLRSFDGFGEVFDNHVPGPFNPPRLILPNPNTPDAIIRLKELVDIDEALLDSVLRRAFDVMEGTTLWESPSSEGASRTSLHDYDFSFRFGSPSGVASSTWSSQVSFARFAPTITPGDPDFIPRFQQEALQHAAAFHQHMGYAERVGQIIDDVEAELRSEMPRTIAWYQGLQQTGGARLSTNDIPIVQNFAEWEEQVSFIRSSGVSFVGDSATADLAGRTGLQTVMVNISSSDQNMGEVRVHGYRILPGRELGEYLAEVPLRLEAQARPGFAFTGWTGDVPLLVNSVDDPVIELSYRAGTSPNIQATFAETTLTLAISEIHYNPEGTAEEEEFLELNNYGTEEIDLSGVHFSAGVTFTFADGTLLAPGAFITLRPDTSPGPLRYSGRLDNGGETLTLNDAAGTELESFRYDDESPWPLGADGLGRSLVRLNPGNDDPSEPFAWRLSAEQGGNPGSSDRLPLIDQTRAGLLNYAFGSINPDIAIRVSPDGTFSLNYAQVLNADAVTVRLMSSADLSPSSWVPVDLSLLESETPPQGNLQTFTLASQAFADRRRFYRLEVSLR